MEPLVVVSAAVVLFYGFRTVREIVDDARSDGSLELVQDHLKRFGIRCTELCRRLSAEPVRHHSHPNYPLIAHRKRHQIKHA